MAEEKPTVFIIDDDPSIRKSLLRLLRSFGFEAETFDSAEEYLERERYQGTGCIVLDVRMPGIDGLALQNELNKADYTMPVIFVTAHGNIPMSVEAMKKGAVDFLPKPFDDNEFLQAVNRAVETDRTAKIRFAGTREILRRIQRLTPREQEVLRYVVSGMPNKQIAFRLGIAEKTVKAHRGRIMKKLEIDSLPELTRLAEKAGIQPL